MQKQTTVLRTAEAGRRVGLSASTMAKLRMRGDGPKYIKVGRRIVVYDVADLDSWLAGRRRGSTSEPDPASKTTP